MGNRFGKICACYGVPCRGPETGGTGGSDEGLGHSFCYVRPETAMLSSSKVHHSEETTTFRSISGAALCANTSTPLSTELCAYAASMAAPASAAAFESSNLFQSIPLQPVPRSGAAGAFSVPIGASIFSGPIERGFMSGPIERGFLSGPLDKNLLSGPLERFQRSFSHGGIFAGRNRKASLIKALRRAIANAVARSSIVDPIKFGVAGMSKEKNSSSVGDLSVTAPGDNIVGAESGKDDADFSFESQNLQWAQGKAGEDRVHVVISEEHEWLFVGIYDGFSGPDAPDYLLSNLYNAVQHELKGLLWDQQPPSADSEHSSGCSSNADEPKTNGSHQNYGLESGRNLENLEKNRNKVWRRSRRNCRSRFKRVSKKWEESHRRWKGQYGGSDAATEGAVDHQRVLNALARALRKTEEAYLEITDKMMMENPELALMGSCVLVMLMKGEDVYLMNVGDSRGVLAQKVEADLWDLERISEETPHDLQFREDSKFSDSDLSEKSPSLSALQLTLDHSTDVEEEVARIRKEHPDDAYAIMNDRVKGSLKVTRAFGAGFLKQPKWNNALLEMFQIDYIGTAPYLTCTPSLYHHRLGPGDGFLILSSDGLYQYFTNEEAVTEVELFIGSSPEGDPAQHLVEEVLFRAAKKAGMDFHELLEIPQGDRRRYHDDVSIIIISLEGRIWRSCV